MFRQEESLTDPIKTVIFREWFGVPDSIIALFPFIPSHICAGECVAYDYFQGWGSADFYLVIEQTVAAKKGSYQHVLNKIIRAGHNVKITTAESVIEGNKSRSTWNMNFIRNIIQ